MIGKILELLNEAACLDLSGKNLTYEEIMYLNESQDERRSGHERSSVLFSAAVDALLRSAILGHKELPRRRDIKWYLTILVGLVLCVRFAIVTSNAQRSGCGEG
jgi:hypothetical protein